MAWAKLTDSKRAHCSPRCWTGSQICYEGMLLKHLETPATLRCCKLLPLEVSAPCCSWASLAVAKPHIEAHSGVCRLHMMLCCHQPTQHITVSMLGCATACSAAGLLL